MKNLRLGRIFAVLLILSFTLFSSTIYASAESYETRNFDVQMEVLENNVFIVNETIKVEFTEPRHGIYRYIPYSGTTTRYVNGKELTEKYKMNISDIEVPGYEFDTYTENQNIVVQIGSADYYVDGAKEYNISYKITLYDDENPDYDSIYLNILPQGWPTAIDESSIKIAMPKEFDAGAVEFISGSFGQADMEAVSFEKDGKTIVAKTTRSLEAYEGVTLNMNLPEGYFTGEKTTGWMIWAMMLLIILAPIISILLWFIFGRDPKVVKTVEFYPPEGTNSAEIGYIIDGVVDSKDIVSMIIYWANAGYITIKEDDEEEFELIKNKDLPENAKIYEKTMFSGLFDNRETVMISDLKEEFYGTFTATKQQLSSYFKMSKENRIFTQGSVGARLMGLLVMLIPLASLGLFAALASKEDSAIMVVFMPVVFMAILGFSLFIWAYDKKDSLSKAGSLGMNIAGIIISVIVAISAIVYSYIMIGNIIPGIAAFLGSFISVSFTKRMKQRTKKSSELLGKILGFKEFIRVAELDRIKLLVEENPNYFYNVLPYAYVFGLTDKWAKNFEGIDIQPPSWYDSRSYNGNLFTTMIFMNSFNNSIRSIQSNIAIPPAPSGGSSSGGGFSGGGAFSGGGMGGGGGGSW